jgi:D-arabinose 1-dehydrogenase-like Zn-dependent alcohol dehydrogenase
MLARGGRYLALGSIVPGQTFAADPSLFIGPNRSLIGVSLYPPATLRAALDFLRRYRHRFPFGQVTSTTFSLEQINEAFRLADQARQQRGAPSRIGVRPHAERTENSGGQSS